MDNTLYSDITELLKIHGLTYKWLVERLNAKGYDISKVTFSKWVHGEQITQKAKEVHEVSLKILDLYCKTFAEKVKDL